MGFSASLWFALLLFAFLSVLTANSYLIDNAGKEIIPEDVLEEEEEAKSSPKAMSDDDVIAPGAIHDRPSLAGKKRWCHRDWPVTNGTWSDSPPYWTPNANCPNRPFDKDATIKCMKGRTLYTMGNSIGRQYAFGLIDMLGGAQVKREDQRDNCPKHETTWDDSCHSVYEGVHVKYLFMQFMDGFNYGPKTGRRGFPFYYADDEIEGMMSPVNTSVTNPSHKVRSRTHISQYNNKRLSRRKHQDNGKWGVSPSDFEGPNGLSFWESDACLEQTTRNCFRRYFKDSKKTDILVFTLGMAYGGDKDKEPRTFDMGSWAKHSAVNFRRHIEATFKGQVFWVTLSPPNMNGYMKGYRDSFADVNQIMWNDAHWSSNMQSIGSEDKPWYTIDTFAINKGRDHLYQDHLHFNGILTHALLTQVFNELCPADDEEKIELPDEGDNDKDKDKKAKKYLR